VNIIYAKVNCAERFGYSAYIDDAENHVSEEARATRQALIGALTQRLDRGYKHKLSACGSNGTEWCNWSICPVCVERTQRSLIIAVAERFRELFSGGRLPIIAAQTDLIDQRYEDIIDINLRSLNRQIQCRYTQAGFPLAFSGVQISASRDDHTGTNVWEAGVCSVIVGLPKR
jgi:hypothetical protein